MQLGTAVTELRIALDLGSGRAAITSPCPVFLPLVESLNCYISILIVFVRETENG